MQKPSVGNYHDLYVTTDVLLLEDIFENFKKVCMEKYGLDPAYYYSLPSCGWDGLVEKGRMLSKRYAKAPAIRQLKDMTRANQ